MKYTSVVGEDDEIPICSYCNVLMDYTYSQPADYSKPLLMMDKNEKRL